MRRYRIELSEEQMLLISNCIDDIHRFASGQWELKNTIDNMLSDLPFEERIKRRNEAEDILRQAKRVLLPDLPDNGFKKYNDSDFLGNTYQIYRNILHKISVSNNHNNVYQYPTLPSGNMGEIKIREI